jgi:hypothetical protein
MIVLCRGGIYMPFIKRCLLLNIRPGSDPMRAAIIADSVIYNGCIMHDHRIVDIYISHNRTIHIDHRRIIPERISLPSAAAESGSIISVSIIYAAIKTNMRSPVPMMKPIVTTGIAPISRGPQKSGLRRKNPNTWYPEITVVGIGPVSRNPQISLYRASRLHIDGQRWRRNAGCNANANTNLGRCSFH